MAGFRTHITTSSVLGVGYGAAAWYFYDVPPAACVVAGGLCGVSGMLPDLDSGPGVPLRESMTFAAAAVPMLMLHRFHRWGMSPESIALAGGAIYVLIRFGLTALLKRFTVHRGMFHSLPAAAIAGEIGFLVCSGEDLMIRYFKAGAVVIGFMSHLVLDEIYSVDLHHVRLKKSFGTAVKFWGDGILPNLATYGLLCGLTYLVLQDPVWMGQFDSPLQEFQHLANQIIEPLQHLKR